MRKIIIVLSMLVIVSMLLVACAEEETPTSAPATEVSLVTEAPTLTEEPAETETVEPAEEGTPVGGIPVTGEEDPSRLSNQLDYDVWSGEGEQIGEVDDMVVDLANTRVSYVVVGSGGFLEIGEKEILVPRDSLTLQTEAGDMTGGERFAFLFEGDQQMFENAPDWDVVTLLPPLGEPAGDWDAEVRNYWESGALPATPAADATATQDENATAIPEATAVTGATAVPNIGVVLDELEGVILATELLGTAINVGADGPIVGIQGPPAFQGTPVPPGTAVATAMPDATATLSTGAVNPGEVMDGNIDDVLVDVNSGEILYFVINVTFDDGERWIPVPVDQFGWGAANGIFVLRTEPAVLQEAPFFENGEFPDTTQEGWDTDFSTFWQ